MAEHNFIAYDWSTKKPILDLPLEGVQFNSPINANGQLTAGLSLSENAADRLDATDPSRTLICVDRNGALVWGGWTWLRQWDKDNRKFKLTVGEFGSYFDRRLLRADKAYAAQDQFVIADDLINHAQSQSGGNVGLALGAQPASGVLRDRSYAFKEVKFIGELLRQLSAVENGFDFSYDVQYSAGLPSFVFNRFYPQRGVSKATTELVFEYPGNILSYSWPEDGSDKSNYVFEVGGQPETTADGTPENITASQDDAADRPAYPLLETGINRSDVVVQSTLQGYANEDLRLRKRPVTTPSLVVRADIAPEFGTYVSGDWCRVVITDERFPERVDGSPGLDMKVRIIDRSVTPGRGEEVKLTMDIAQ